MIEHNSSQRPMSIEEATNFLKEKTKDIKKVVKKDVDKAQISTAMPEDRKKYLNYVLSLLDNVSPEVYRAFLGITGTISSSLTKKQVAELLRRILVCRTVGYSISAIARSIKEPVEVTKKIERLGLIAVGEAIERHKLGGVPIINVN